MHGVVVAGQHGCVRAHHTGLLGGLVVAGVDAVEGQREAVGPAFADPQLVLVPDLGQVVVLHPGQVPDQPGDAVCLRVRPEGQQLRTGILEHGVHDSADPAV